MHRWDQRCMYWKVLETCYTILCLANFKLQFGIYRQALSLSTPYTVGCFNESRQLWRYKFDVIKVRGVKVWNSNTKLLYMGRSVIFSIFGYLLGQMAFKFDYQNWTHILVTILTVCRQVLFFNGLHCRLP